jgi:hypothetical protein
LIILQLARAGLMSFATLMAVLLRDNDRVITETLCAKCGREQGKSWSAVCAGRSMLSLFFSIFSKTSCATIGHHGR